MSEEKRVWGIHTFDDGLFMRENVIGIGWREMGDLGKLSDRESFKEKYARTYPKATKQSVANCAGMIYRFAREVQIGDYVVYPSKVDRTINLGVVEGDYIFCPEARDYVQQRKVRWEKKLPRTAFSQGALYEIGSAMTFFTVKNYADEFLDALLSRGHRRVMEGEEDESVAATAEDIIESTKDFILKELSRNLKGYDLEDSSPIFCRRWGTGRSSRRTAETAGSISPPIRTNCRRGFWCR